jgi:hypothetical protein
MNQDLPEQGSNSSSKITSSSPEGVTKTDENISILGHPPEKSSDAKNEHDAEVNNKDGVPKPQEKKSSRTSRNIGYFDSAKKNTEQSSTDVEQEKFHGAAPSSTSTPEEDRETEKVQKIFESGRYENYASEHIEQEIKQIDIMIDTITEEIDDIEEKIRGVVESLKTIPDGTELFRNEKRLQAKYEQERDFKYQDSQKFIETVEKLREILEYREKLKKEASSTPEHIKSRIAEINTKIDVLNEEITNLNEENLAIVRSLRTITTNTEQFRTEKRKQLECTNKRNRKKQEYHSLVEKVAELRKLLELRERLQQSGILAENISLTMLFSEESPIKNAMLYAATFFQKLPIKDFQQLVSSLLQEQTIDVKIIEEDADFDKDRNPIKSTIKKNLVDIWNESFFKPNTFMEDCYLELRRDNNTQYQYIDFVVPELRNRFIDFFDKKQPFYAERMLSNIEELVFFDPSDKIAEGVSIILSEVMISQPNRYRANWLISIVQNPEKRNVEFSRVVDLLYRVQIRLDPKDSWEYTEEFLMHIIDSNEYLTIKIVSYLLYRHLLLSLSNVNGIESIKNLLRWLQNLLDVEMKVIEEDENHIAWKAFSVIETLLSQDVLWENSASNYFYELLGFLRDWLPTSESNPKNYSFLDVAALIILPRHLIDTIGRVQGERLTGKRKYGVYPLKYPLFNIDNNQLLDGTYESKINLLIRWLFYPYNELTSDAVLAVEESEILGDDLIKLIAKFVLEWFAILLGFDLDPDRSNPEGSQIATILLKQVILVASKQEQKKLYQSLAEISDELLDKAVEFEAQGEMQLSKECRSRRNLAKNIRARFNEHKNLVNPE